MADRRPRMPTNTISYQQNRGPHTSVGSTLLPSTLQQLNLPPGSVIQQIPISSLPSHMPMMMQQVPMHANGTSQPLQNLVPGSRPRFPKGQDGGAKASFDPKTGLKTTFTSASKVFVGGLPTSCTVEDVKNLFSQFGKMIQVAVHPKNYLGFLRMENLHNAQRAIAELDGMTFRGRRINVSFAKNNSKIWVGDLAPWITDDLLIRAFFEFGELEAGTGVAVDSQGNSLGYGFVQFATAKDANEAIRQSEDVLPDGSVAAARPGGDGKGDKGGPQSEGSGGEGCDRGDARGWCGGGTLCGDEQR
eukprot:10453_1